MKLLNQKKQNGESYKYILDFIDKLKAELDKINDEIRELLKKIHILKKTKARKTRKYRLDRSKIILDTKLFSMKSIDLYEEVLQCSRNPSGLTEVKWVQPYSKVEEALLYVTSQFKALKMK